MRVLQDYRFCRLRIVNLRGRLDCLSVALAMIRVWAKNRVSLKVRTQEGQVNEFHNEGWDSVVWTVNIFVHAAVFGKVLYLRNKSSDRIVRNAKLIETSSGDVRCLNPEDFE